MVELKPIPHTTIPRSEFDKYPIWSEMRRCVVRDNITVNYYLHPNDSTKKEDGTPANLIGSDGQVMVEIKKFWWKWEVGTIKGKRTFRWWISDRPKDGFTVHPAFYRDRDGDGIAEEVDERYYGAYLGFSSGGKLMSRTSVIPTGQKTISTFRTEAQKRGKGWGLVDYHLLHAVQLLYLLEYGHFDSKTKIGRGYVEGNSEVVDTGKTNRYGNKSFGETTGKHQLSYRGIEDFWGNCYYWIDGIVSDSNRNVLIGNVNFNNNGTGYKKYVMELSNNVNSFIGDIHDNQELGFLIKEGGGSATTKLYNYVYLYSSSVAVFGGHRASRSNTGVFSLHLLHSTSNTRLELGARLAC
ncbi:hypothetical protein [Bacillus chungangensis]|uniref:Uncharacterized protein n=1 Tax=Bacillus chungangensis TaxID=587633 RepID=A0ABT9WU41_9BACI|nr:hypothetical protein [Bacillus chungangensis]MDQ0176744.1 hypothetical protein [Bacillus chungangensis]